MSLKVVLHVIGFTDAEIHELTRKEEPKGKGKGKGQGKKGGGRQHGGGRQR